MSTFRDTMEKSDIFQLFKQMQHQLFDFKTLKLFILPKPVCLQNEHSLTMFYLNTKWPEEFPSLQTIKKFIKDEKKLFYLPEEDYYYLYYYLLKAYKNFLKLDKEINDIETPLDYDTINDYLIRNNLNATKFFEIYFEKGQNLNDDDLTSASLKQIDEVTNYKFNENFKPRKMTPEPIILSIDHENENENEIEIAKTVSPLPSTQFEIEVEDLHEGKVREEE